ncbi:hypothetical protein LXL04_030201 [Taraxacum kok-saghyz]
MISIEIPNSPKLESALPIADHRLCSETIEYMKLINKIPVLRRLCVFQNPDEVLLNPLRMTFVMSDQEAKDDKTIHFDRLDRLSQFDTGYPGLENSSIQHKKRITVGGGTLTLNYYKKPTLTY